MDEISADYIVYCIMLDDYLEQNGINSSDDEEFFEKERDYFPSDWEINYSLEEKLKILADAIKNKKNLREYEKGDLIEDTAV